MEQAVPILPSRDLRETLAFYEPLGFENRGADPEEWGYLILGRGDIWLHFALQADLDPLTTASGCYVYVDDADALHAAWSTAIEADSSSGSRIVAPATTDYGMREFAVIDRSGNLLRLGTQVARGR
jgi:hypothetical protein